MERVALLNGKNKNQDYDISKILQGLATSGVVEGLAVTTGQVAVGYAFIEVSRDGESFYVLYQNTANVVIDTTGTKKVWIAIDQTKVDDGTNNSVDGSGIGSIQTGASYPASNYIPLASITGGVITDERGFIKIKGKAITGIIQEAKSSNIVSASTTDLSTATGNFVHITGTTTITSFGIIQAGLKMILVFDSSLLLTHNATSLILPTGANITTQAGDAVIFESEGSGNWRCVSYLRKDGSALTGTTSSNELISYFGDGSDGDVTISSNITLTKDTYYNNLTITTGFTLDPNGYQVFVRGVLTTQGTGKISRNGNVGGNASGNTAGTGATILNQGSIGGELQAGGGGVSVNGGNATAGTAGTSGNPAYTNTSGATGGTGQSGNFTGGAGGTGGTSTQGALYNKVTLPKYSTYPGIQLSYKSSGAGGGGGGSSYNSGIGFGGAGGGAGSNGGVISISAYSTSGTINIESKGGNGGNGSTQNSRTGGGGAGGNGGVIVFTYKGSPPTINAVLTGGIGGTGYNAGGNGSTGSLITISV